MNGGGAFIISLPFYIYNVTRYSMHVKGFSYLFSIFLLSRLKYNGEIPSLGVPSSVSSSRLSSLNYSLFALLSSLSFTRTICANSVLVFLCPTQPPVPMSALKPMGMSSGFRFYKYRIIGRLLSRRRCRNGFFGSRIQTLEQLIEFCQLVVRFLRLLHNHLCKMLEFLRPSKLLAYCNRTIRRHRQSGTFATSLLPQSSCLCRRR
mgnify:CR=1 FL=1